MVTGVNIRPGGLHYGVTWGSGSESWHYEYELTPEFVADFAGLGS
jgi:hypothetical protein